MSQKIVNADGSEVEVFTLQELNEQKQIALDEKDKTANEEIAKLNEELNKLKDKDLNFANLRESKEKSEKQIEELKKEIDLKLAATKKEVLEGTLKDHFSENLKNLSGDDEALKKKIEYHYNRLQDTALTREEVAKKLRDAWTLATQETTSGAMNSAVISSGNVVRPKFKSEQSFTPEEKAFAQKLARAGGIKLEDKDFQ